ncbi:hypothetical protein EI94DRAFT_1707951 [Lactarius quietus]|nr:hypothetical protein EI94DRAFT_1707951 [Lactarius quietus]
MSSFKFLQNSPSSKSAPLSPFQRQGALNAAARPFTLPGLSGTASGIDAITGAALSPDSLFKALANGNGSRNANSNHDISHRLELQQYEECPEAILEPKLDYFREETSELLALDQDVLSRLTYLPDSVPASINVKQLADSKVLACTVTEDFQNVKSIARTHSDLQVKVAKVRTQYGAVKVKKYIMLERIDSERDQLRAKANEIQAVKLPRVTSVVSWRTMEAPSRSLALLKASDMVNESHQEHFLEADNLNVVFNAGKQGLVSKGTEVHSLERQAGFASHENGTSTTPRKENDTLACH